MVMMVMPRPIFLKSKDVMGYALSFQIGNALLEEGKSNAVLNLNLPFFDVINKVGLEVLTYDKPIFVPVTDLLLATDLEQSCHVNFGQVVLSLDKRVKLSSENLQRVIRFKSLGFKIALTHVSSISALDAFLPYTDYVFCKHTTDILSHVLRFIRMKGYALQVVATGIETTKEFDVAVFFGVELLSGQFYILPTYDKDSKVSPLQVNYIQLINQVNKDDFEFDQFSKIVQRDTALAIQFLRMVNSSRIKGSKIKTLRHAAAMLGQVEIKRWITTAVTTMLSENKPSEIARISLLRAKFCQNMARHFEMAINSENLFLMGLFSVVDVILGVPMEQALALVMIPDEIRAALLDGTGKYAPVYEFIKMYELGNWSEVSRIALVRGINVADIRDAYLDTLLWYGNLINLKAEDDELTEATSN